MPFSSALYPGEMVIDDSTPDSFFEPAEGRGRGLDLGLRGPDGYGDTATAFPDELLIPESEWEERIKEMEERKTRLSDLILQAGLPCKDQQQTNYCWINAPTHCVEILRVLQGQAMVSLSPASAGAQIKNYRNVGGWGKEGLDWIIEHGLYPTSMWPDTAIGRQYKTPEGDQEALKYRVTEWWELRPRNKQQMISCLLRRIPIAKGYNWWSHETTDYDPVWVNGQVGVRDRNSWGMKYGTQGFFVLQGTKMLGDDAVCPRVARAA